MVIKKKNTSQKIDKDWFMFSAGLSHHVFSDYVSLKLAFQLEPLAFAQSNLVKMAEVVEKAFKLFLAVHEKRDDSLSHYSSEYGHNLEKLRAKAANFETIFNDEDIKQYCQPFEGKLGPLFQFLRYGSQSSIEGFKTKLGDLMPIVEKVFFNCVLRIPEPDKKLINTSSLLRFLITDNPFHQSNNKNLLIQAVKENNPYFTEYEEYSWELENEQRELQKAIMQHEANR